jgi:Fic family protein
MLMGEAASKCQHLAVVPLMPGTAEHLNQVYLAKGAAANTAIEGNTLSEEQVLAQVQGRLELPPSMEYQRQEVENVLRAYEGIAREITGPEEDPQLCAELVRRYNRQVLEGLNPEDAVPGEYRTHSVVVGKVYRGAPAEECPWLMGRMCEWLNGPDFHPPDIRYRVPFAMLRAVIAHLYLAWIHPFGDGNGRTARLLEYHLLLAAGVPAPAGHLLSDYYYRTRPEYYRQLAAASQSGGDVLPFVQYAVQGFVEGLREQLRVIRLQQWQVSWVNYVHERFREEKTNANQKRRRDLVLDLSNREGFVDISEIPNLSPRQGEAYRGGNPRVLRYDINVLAGMGLIEHVTGKVRAKREIILAFLPAKAQGRVI